MNARPPVARAHTRAAFSMPRRYNERRADLVFNRLQARRTCGSFRTIVSHTRRQEGDTPSLGETASTFNRRRLRFQALTVGGGEGVYS